MRSGVYGIFRGEICLYIGKAMNLLRRRRQHERGRKSNRRLQAIIAEHGLSALRWEVLEYCEPDELRACEQVWLMSLQPTCNVVVPPTRAYTRPQPAILTPQEWTARFGQYRRMFPTAAAQEAG